MSISDEHKKNLAKLLAGGYNLDSTKPDYSTIYEYFTIDFNIEKTIHLAISTNLSIRQIINSLISNHKKTDFDISEAAILQFLNSIDDYYIKRLINKLFNNNICFYPRLTSINYKDPTTSLEVFPENDIVYFFKKEIGIDIDFHGNLTLEKKNDSKNQLITPWPKLKYDVTKYNDLKKDSDSGYLIKNYFSKDKNELSKDDIDLINSIYYDLFKNV